MPFKRHAVAGESEVALVGDDADLGVHGPDGGATNPLIGMLAGGSPELIDGVAVEDGQIPRRQPGGLVGDHQRPARVDVGLRCSPERWRRCRCRCRRRHQGGDVGEALVIRAVGGVSRLPMTLPLMAAYPPELGVANFTSSSQRSLVRVPASPVEPREQDRRARGQAQGSTGWN